MTPALNGIHGTRRENKHQKPASIAPRGIDAIGYLVDDQRWQILAKSVENKSSDADSIGRCEGFDTRNAAAQKLGDNKQLQSAEEHRNQENDECSVRRCSRTGMRL